MMVFRFIHLRALLKPGFPDGANSRLAPVPSHDISLHDLQSGKWCTWSQGKQLLSFSLHVLYCRMFADHRKLQLATKELRYLYARFYFWCMVPAVQDSMEGCPPSNVNLVYLILSALLGLFIFLVVYALLKIKKGHKRAEVEKSRRASMVDSEFQELQRELYGDKLKRLKHQNTSFATSVMKQEIDNNETPEV